MKPESTLLCGGCGVSPASDVPYPFRCPNAGMTTSTTFS
jgi:hypothetical protein